ncbi:hypothetical protein D3C86_1335300 [compost metagenome]
MNVTVAVPFADPQALGVETTVALGRAGKVTEADAETIHPLISSLNVIGPNEKVCESKVPSIMVPVIGFPLIVKVP